MLLLANSVSRRSWSLCSGWKNMSRTCGWGVAEQLYLPLLIESPVLPREAREKEGLESFGTFLYHLELGAGERIHHHLAPLTCGLGGGALESRGRAVPSQTVPTLACLTISFICTYPAPFPIICPRRQYWCPLKMSKSRVSPAIYWPVVSYVSQLYSCFTLFEQGSRWDWWYV
jgi:hypothetical protein